MFRSKRNHAQFFMVNKEYGYMARFKKTKNPFLKKTKLALVDYANTLGLLSIIGYCLICTCTSIYVIKSASDNISFFLNVVK